MRNMSPTLRRALAAVTTALLVAGSALVVVPAATAVPLAGVPVVIQSPTPGALVDGTFTISGTAEPNAFVEITIDGAFGPFVQASDAGTFSYPATLADGPHSILVEASGHDYSSASVSVVVDGTAPTLTVVEPADGAVVRSGWVTMVVGFSDPNASSWFALFDGQEIPFPFYDPATVSFGAGLPDGVHTIGVRVVDALGHSTSVTRTVTVDTSAPSSGFQAFLGGTQRDIVDGTRIDPRVDTALTMTPNRAVAWAVSLDGNPATGTLGSNTFTLTAPGWTDNNAPHQLRFVGTDDGGRTVDRTFTVYADTKKPDLTIDAIPSVRAIGSSVGGTVSDVGGVASVQVEIRRLRVEVGCGAVLATSDGVLTSGRWAAPVPEGLAAGEYCLRVVATDTVGNERVEKVDSVSIDTQAPAAPVIESYTPVWAPDALSWRPVSDATSYEYRATVNGAEGLDDAEIQSVSDTNASIAELSADVTWQVRAIDAAGNVGGWSDIGSVDVLDAPVIDTACGGPACTLVGSQLALQWSAVPGAVGYRVAVVWRGEAGAEDNIAERFVTDAATSTTLDLPVDLPSGVLTVKVRAVMDQKIQGARLGPWSDTVRVLHVAAPVKPTLLTPVGGEYVDGDQLELAWTDDSSAFLWEVRIARTATLGEDGGLDVAEIGSDVLLDPMILLLVVSGSGEVPRGFDLDEFDAIVDCATLIDFIGGVNPEASELPFGCADGSVVLPEGLEDGAYYWQVRGHGIDGFASLASEPGPWSNVGHFNVGQAPLTPGTGGGGTGGGGTGGGGTPATTVKISTPSPTTVVPPAAEAVADDPADEQTSEAPEDAAEEAVGGGADSAEDQTATTTAGDEFPMGWLIAGIAALLVLAGAGAFIRFLIVRAR